jgi:hypothetical protein
MTLLPVASFLPGMEANNVALAIPLLNLFLLMKSDRLVPLAVAGVLTETLGLIALCIIIGDYISMMRNSLVAGMPFKRPTRV